MRCIWIVNDVRFWLPDILNLPFNYISSILIAFHIYFSYWLTAWLCVFYSIFIANFSHQTFLWIKRNLLAFLPQVLFLTGVGSLAISLLAYTWRRKLSSLIPNSTNGTAIEGVYYMYMIISIILGSCLPFTGIAISLVVSLSSLLKHVNNVSQTGFNVQIHVTLIKAMAMLLIISVSSFFCYSINLAITNKSNDPSYFIIQSLMLIIPTLESIIIIKASPKLRKNFLRYFCFRGTGEN
ncbi:taste receptor type 2 member 46-like [Rana temporaria]|uniref:taste receptor type 2 member 46-like n=1 Tax=Rana temporaria TaxID=8407 RepID=UPI001AAC663A|nr:taste receptor type 2 member 46-like [Rana temporaria]